jgi:putative peptidoglycan lipid II flippase
VNESSSKPLEPPRSDASVALPGAKAGPPSHAGLARSAGLVGIATTASRLLGLVREQTVALLFGAGMETDAFNVAFRIPNLLRDLFAEGALSSAFVPTFTAALTQEGSSRAFQLASRVLGALLSTVGPLCLLGIFFAPSLVHAIAPGIWAIPGKGELTVHLTRIMLPFLLLIAVAAQAMGMLNSLGSYFLPAVAPVMLNLGMIVVGSGLALLAPRLGMVPIVGLSIGVMVGGFGQLAVQVPPLVRAGLSLRPRISFSDPGVRRILMLMGPAAIGLAATQINILVNTQIASYLIEGSISWLNYAFRLMQLPIGLFGVSVATVTLPAVSRHLALGQRREAGEVVSRATRLVLVLTVPASVALAVLAHPIVALLYQYRRFLATDTDRTAEALLFYSVGLVGYSLVKVLVPVFYALGETRIPVRASFLAVGINIALNLLLMVPMGHSGLALATSITGLGNLALLVVPLSRRFESLIGREGFTCLGKVGAASAAMGLLLHLATKLVQETFGTHRLVARLLAVLVPVFLGSCVFFGVARLLGIPETDEILETLRRKCGSREKSGAASDA